MSTETTVEELEQKLAATDDPRQKIEVLLEAGRATEYTNPALACEYATRGLHIAEEIQDRYWIARMLYALYSFEKLTRYANAEQKLVRLHRAASLFEELGEEVWLAKVVVAQSGEYRQRGDYGRAKELCEQSTALFKQVGDKKNYANGLYRLSEIHHSIGNLPQAVAVSVEALSLYTELNDVYGKGICYNTLGGVYMAISEPEKALEYYGKGVECMRSFGQKLLEAIGLLNIGNAYMDLGRFDEALENYQYAQRVCAELGFPDKEAIAWLQIGEVNEELEKWRDALSCYQKAERLLRTTGSREALASIYRGISSVYRKQKRWKMAKRYGEKALKESIDTERLSEQYVLHQQLSEINEQLGELPEALAHHKRYAELREEVLGTEKQKAIAEMQAKFDVENAEREKELFRVKNVELTSALEEVSRLNERLTQLNREKNEVLGVVAHDLQGPLSGVKMVAELVQLHYKQMPEGELEQQLGTIAQTSERMLAIATALLQAQALESRAEEETSERVDVGTELGLLVSRYREFAVQKGIELEYTAPEPVVELLCNRLGLQQVVENLLSNALKFSPRGKRVGVQVAQKKGIVRVEVWDEGPGVSAKDKKRLFGKFARLSAAPTGGESSTGLGLWIVRQRVEQMGGAVRCISKAGAGARFVAELPL